jgi:hypothetical protein
MRMTMFGLGALCLLVSGTGHTAPAPNTADEAIQLQMEAVGDRWPERWQGRQHYLYDEAAPAVGATDGSNPSDARACATDAMRVRKPDGSTTIAHIRRCD